MTGQLPDETLYILTVYFVWIDPPCGSIHDKILFLPIQFARRLNDRPIADETLYILTIYFEYNLPGGLMTGQLLTKPHTF